VKIRFYAHASFRLEADGLAVFTDPYTPGPHNSGFDPIDEPADVVIMSSATDPFHSDPSYVRGDPSYVMLDLEFDSLSASEAVKAALGEVEFDSSSEAEAVRAALDDPTSPPDVAHGLRVRIIEVVETKEY
jgi:hypothetical protein